MKLRLAMLALALSGGCARAGDAPESTSSSASPSVAQALVPSTATGLWTDRTQLVEGRLFTTLQDQPARKRALMYGGYRIDSGVLTDTWEWDGFGWIRRIPDDDPGPRFAASTVWDPIRKRVLLFGGFTLERLLLADTLLWEWDGNDWAAIRSDNPPPARACASMVWDPVESRALAFGGFVGGDGEKTTVSASNDLWSFDGRDWAEVPTEMAARPTAGACNGLAYDSARDRFVLQVGFDFIQTNAGNLVLGYRIKPETWVWDRATWTKLPTELPSFDLGAPTLAEESPGVMSLFVDAGQRGVVLTLVNDQWVESQTRADKLLGSSAVWSSANDAFLVTNGGPPTSIGSVDVDEIKGDWLASSTRPFERKPDAVAPSARRAAASAELADGRVVMFGGLDAAQSYLADTYVWDGGRWSAVAATGGQPAPRTSHAMAALGQGSVLLFGGQGASLLGDTWKLDVATMRWSQITVPAGAGPSPRRRSAMASLGDAVVLFGGENSGDTIVYDAETWVFREPGGWSRITTPLSPSARSNSALAAAGDGTVRLYGGSVGGAEPTSAEQWSFDGAAWTLLGNYAPVFRRGHRLASDSPGSMLLIGGTGSLTAPDVFDISSRTIFSVEARVREDHQTLPARRTLEATSSNPRTGGIVRFGGQESDGTFLGDTWQLQRFGAACTPAGGECGATMACTEGVCCETSDCGPCRTCAAPGSPGLCSPRGVVGPEPGCEGELACNASGQCRRANESACVENEQCASDQCLTAGRDAGICCSNEGCAVRCVGSELQQPDGTRTTCGAYGCEGQSCRITCTSVSECAEGFVCDGRGACVRGEAGGESDGGCGCDTVGSRTSELAWLVGLIPLGLALGLRRTARRSGAASPRA